ncbi:MAG: glycine cleavage system aminomethyltransferase GcvT [Armatimonadetes bacterium]|nr:glycine cleavage system aminomethyltransferase GcvT [Armatimonadota bacterium]
MSPKRTPLYGVHVAAGARIVEFGGWEMPVQYSSILDEHRAVRGACGMFDVSHMGEVEFTGPNALATVQRLIANDAARLALNQGLYTQMCTEEGGIVDDLIIYRLGDQHIFMVINAATTDADLEWIRAHGLPNTDIRDRSADFALIALQGPRAQDILSQICPADLAAQKYFRIIPETRVAGRSARIARTGYTGEDGFEIFTTPEDAGPVWEALMKAGRGAGLLPAGLGARDTLRLEAGYLLYGQDMDRTITPLEAGLGWSVKLEKGGFIGRDALARQKEQGLRRRLVGFEVMDRAVARHGYPVLSGGAKIGDVTSGTFSPTLVKSIGMGCVPAAHAEPGSEVQVEIRGKAVPARVVKLPFYKRPR